MKKLEFATGGRPVANDDFQALQDVQTSCAVATFVGRGAFIVNGCQVSGPAGGPYNVSAGLVFLDGELRRFNGASNVSLPAQFQLGAFDLNSIDSRPYESGTTLPCIREQFAVIVPTNPAYVAGEFLPLYTWGAKRWEHVLRGLTRSMHEIQEVASYVAADYDATGKGLPGSEAWGWALCNGQDGRADLRGRFTAGFDPGQADFGIVGNRGGNNSVTLLLNQMPRHKFKLTYLYKTDAVGNDWRLLAAGNNGATNNGTHPNQPTDNYTDELGGDQPFDNRPSFHTVLKRQWIGY